MISCKEKRLIYWATIFLSALIIPLQFAGEAHAAISYVGSASTPADNGSQEGPTVAVTPPSMQAGDFVLIIGGHRGGGPSMSETGGQTWTTLTSASNDLRTRLFYCIFNGTWTANPSITFADSYAMSAIMHVFRGVDQTSPLDVAQTTGTFSAPSSPYDVTIGGITTNTDGAWVIAVWGQVWSETWTLQTGGWTNLGGAQYRNTAGSMQFSISAAYKAVSPAGGSGNVTNREGGTQNGTTHILALKPASPANLTQIHYRWRNDNGGESGSFDTGTGADGSVTISTGKNINTDVLGSNRSTNADGISTTVTANPTGTSISVTSTTGFAANDEIILINLRGSSGDYADVGNYEFLEIASIGSGILNLKSSVQKSYDGTTFSNQLVVVQRVPQWTSVTIQNGGSLTANDWPSGTGGGLLVFRATGTVTVDSGGSINVNAKGYRGGAGVTGGPTDGNPGESYSGTTSAGPSNNLGGGGGGDRLNSGDICGEGGAGASYGTSGTTGAYGTSCNSQSPVNTAGATYGAAELTTLYLGSGGGSGADESDSTGGTTGSGGDGGGIIVIFADTISVSGAIEAKGSAGGTYTGDCSDSGSGGGGSGGSIYLAANTATLGTTLVKATGGAGGSYSCSGWHGDGGSGGKGRIRVEANTKSGTTDPTYSGAGTPGGSGATFAADQDTKLTGLAKSTPKRVRFEVSNEGGQSSGGVTYQLQVAQTSTCSSGTYSAVPTDASGHWQIVGSDNITEPAATSNIASGLTDEAATFVEGQLKDAGNTTGSITLAGDAFTEIEFSVQATTNAANGANYCFRLYDTTAGAPLNTYSKYAEATITGAFEYRRTITIDYTKLGASCLSDHTDLTDFPVLISITGDTNLKDKANSGHVESSSGYDIIFRSGADQKTQLYHEIESYSPSAGDLVAWVKVPTIKHDENTTIYMYYGNASMTSAPPASLAQGVWDSNFVAVWHLKENPGGSAPQMKDSKGSNHGTSQGSMGSEDQVSARANGGLDLDRSESDYIDATNSTLNVGQTFTLEAWVKRDGTGSETLLTKVRSDQYSFKLSFSSNVLRLDAYTGSGYNNVEGATITDTTSYHHVGAYSNGTNLKVFTDGAVHTNSGSTPASIPYDSSNLWIGVGRWGSNPVDFLDGRIDEVRISNIARSACWIETEYKNVTESGFYDVAAETSASPTAINLSTFEASAYDEGVMLQWRTGYEVNNLGFHVYREEGGQLYPLTSEPIKGSALMTGPGHITAGYSYTWWDTSVPSLQLSAPRSKLPAIKYWLEDIDLNGTKTLHGPVTPVFSHKPAPKKAQSILLSQINKQGAGVRSQDSGFRIQNPAVSGRRSAIIPLPQAEPMNLIWFRAKRSSSPPQADAPQAERSVSLALPAPMYRSPPWMTGTKSRREGWYPLAYPTSPSRDSLKFSKLWQAARRLKSISRKKGGIGSLSRSLWLPAWILR